MRTSSLRARIAAALTLVLAAGALLAAPAAAEAPTIEVRVVPATEVFMTDHTESLTGIVEVFDASSDSTVPVAQAAFGFETPLLGTAVPFTLPPGTYKVRATADGYLPGWFQYLGGDTSATEGDLGDLPWLFGARSDSSRQTSTVVTVGEGGMADHRAFSIMLHDAATSVAGILGTWGIEQGWSVADRLTVDQVGFVELYAVGDPEPVQTLEVTPAAAFVFRDVELGSYELRAVLGTVPGSEGVWPHDGLTPADLEGAIERWYPGTSDRAEGRTVTIDAAHPHWDGSSIAMDEPPAAVSGLTGAIAVTGQLHEGATLTAGYTSGGELDGIPLDLLIPLHYEWRLNDVPVDGAVGPTFALPPGSAGSTVTVNVISTLGPAAILTSELSSPTGPVGPPPLPLLTSTPVPLVTGTVQVGQRLTADPGTWGPGNVPKTYQWTRDGAPIAGATAKTYRVTAGDVGARLAVTVTGNKSGYAPAARTSASTTFVPGQVFANAPTPTVRGHARVGVELSVGSVAWRPAPVELSYQWTRDEVPIPGATGPTYRVVADDHGASLAVTVVGRKAGFVTQVRTSAPTAPVTDGTISAPRPALVGPTTAGSTLSIDTSSWTPADVQIAYAWQRSGSGFVTVATSPTYTLGAADVGKKIRLIVTVTAPGYTPVQRTTSATPNITP